MACMMLVWWNFLLIPSCFSRSLRVRWQRRRPSTRCCSSSCVYCGRPMSHAHLCATQVWSNFPAFLYLLQQTTLILPLMSGKGIFISYLKLGCFYCLYWLFKRVAAHTDGSHMSTYTVAGSRSSSIASLSFRRCKGRWICRADSSSESLKPSRI